MRNEPASMVGHVGVFKLGLARKPVRKLIHAKKTVLGFKNLEIWLIGSEHPSLTFTFFGFK